ncbi:MAG: DUF4878 domain-containing protein [Bacteroidetes bacterium]|nr:DUF4878 domain-containing protein [Bacteroidota bacterium]MBS1756534.1 DUF4878 domain-containing protein [Bacteroidota bacterium]
MKKIILSAAIICTAVLFGCKNMGGGDPKTVLVEFMDALAKKDIASARKLATAESKSMLDLIEMGMKSNESKDMDKYDKSKLEIGDAKIDGDKATVPVKEKGTDETTNFTLKKENGDWKVAFDKTSMMQMGMEKMNQHGGLDSLKEGMDKLKDVNMDSLKDNMQKGLNALDSLKKEMNKNQ